MSQTLVATDSTASRVNAVVAMLDGISRGRGLSARPLPRARARHDLRVVPFMSAKQAIAGVERGLIARETSAARSSVGEPGTAPTLATMARIHSAFGALNTLSGSTTGAQLCVQPAQHARHHGCRARRDLAIKAAPMERR